MIGLYLLTTTLLERLRVIKFGMSMRLEFRWIDYLSVFQNSKYEYYYEFIDDLSRNDILEIENEIIQIYQDKRNEYFQTEYFNCENKKEFHKTIVEILNKRNIKYKCHTEHNFKRENYDDYIDVNKRELMGIIEKNENWNDSSKEGLYFMIARYLYNKKNNDRYVKIYSRKGFEIMEKNKKKEEKNELDAKEMEAYKEHDYFVNILKTHQVDPDDIKDHYSYLLLSLLVLQPPLRTSFYSSAFLLETLDRNNGKDNYIYLNRRGKVHAYYFVNKDKASNYKLYKMDKNLSKIQIMDDNLAELINDSFIKYPRKYLFEINKKAVSEATLLKWLRNITGIDKINFDMMRSIYITNFYKHNKTYGKRDELSRHMRHSQATASKNYLKIFDDETAPTEPEYKDSVILVKQIKKLETQLKKCKNEVDEPLYRKRRSDIIYRYNKKGVKPKQDTIDKYNILYDDSTKLYL